MRSKIVRLIDRSLIRLSGEAAPEWFSGLNTQNTVGLAPGAPVHGALLTPQGRLLADFFIWRIAEGLILDVEASAHAMLLQRLALYRLREPVRIEALDGAVYVAFDGAQEPGFVPDPRLSALGGRRMVAPGEPLVAETADLAAWHGFRRKLGVAETGADGLADKVYAVEANLDLLNGVDFHKGCFVGQETTSRMKRRGQVKSRLLPILSEELESHPGEILAGERRAGEALVMQDGVGVGLMRLDRLEGALMLGQTAVTAVPPVWMAPVLPSTSHGSVEESTG